MNIAQARDTVMKTKDTVLLRTGVEKRRQTCSLAGGRYTAEFAVETANELHRTRTAAGEAAVLVPFLDGLEPEMTVWDVGGAVGTWTCFAGRPGAAVRAFEPHRGNGDRLLENARLNEIAESVTLERVALGDRRDELTLTVEGGVGTGTHRIGGGGNGSQRVAVERGDAYSPGPDALKLDVEGYELEVLDGLGSHLDGVRLAVVEVHPQHGVPVAAVRDRLETAGLDVDEVSMDREERYLFGRRPTADD